MGIDCWARAIQLLFQMDWEFPTGPVLTAKGPDLILVRKLKPHKPCGEAKIIIKGLGSDPMDEMIDLLLLTKLPEVRTLPPTSASSTRKYPKHIKNSETHPRYRIDSKTLPFLVQA